MGATSCSGTQAASVFDQSCGRQTCGDTFAPPCGDNAPTLDWGKYAVQELRLLRASAEGDLEKIAGLLKDKTFVDTRKRPTMRPRAEGLDDYDQENDDGGPKEVLELDVSGKLKRFGESKDPLRGIGLTPLMLAAQEGHPKAVQMLLLAKANPNLQDEDGMTPLHFAAQAECYDTCIALLAAGASAEAQDDEGRTAFYCLSKKALISRADREEWESLLRREAEPLPPTPSTSSAPEITPEAPRQEGREDESFRSPLEKELRDQSKIDKVAIK